MDFKRGITVFITLMCILFSVNVFANYGKLSNIITTTYLNFNVTIPEYYEVIEEEYLGSIGENNYNKAVLFYDEQGVESLKRSVKWNEGSVSEKEFENLLEDKKLNDEVKEELLEDLPDESSVNNYFIKDMEDKVLILLSNKKFDTLYIYEVY